MTEYIKIKGYGANARTLNYRVERTESYSIVGMETVYYGRRVRANNHLQGFGSEKLICTSGDLKFRRYQLETR